jgi:hypothetical protein
MKKNSDPIETLSEIRNMMDRSSRFISLSGLSGVAAGIIALVGATIVWVYGEFQNVSQYNPLQYELHINRKSFPWFTMTIALCMLAGAISMAIYFTLRNAQKKGLPVWDKTSRRLVIHLAIPLIAGGIFGLILLSKGYLEQVAPVTLLFYGLALLNGSKFTLDEIRYLAYTEIILGLLSSYYTGMGIIFWAAGFGLCHIIYGIKMYFRYEK